MVVVSFSSPGLPVPSYKCLQGVERPSHCVHSLHVCPLPFPMKAKYLCSNLQAALHQAIRTDGEYFLSCGRKYVLFGDHSFHELKIIKKKKKKKTLPRHVVYSYMLHVEDRNPS